jgi:hypothetical protein
VSDLVILPAMETEDVVIAPGGLLLHLGLKEIRSPNWLRVAWPGAPYPIAARLGRSTDGGVVCSGLVLGGAVDGSVAEVTAGSLRKIPLGLLLDALSGRVTSGKGSTWLDSLPGFQRPTRLGPRGIPVDKLAEIAKLYRQARIERPSSPVKWLSEQIVGPEGKPTPAVTVRRWLQRCRDLGLLGPSIPGKAGEALPRKTRRKR